MFTESSSQQERYAQLEREVITRSTLAVSNRMAMPRCTEIVDAFREIFGPVKVTYAAEAGMERGKRHDVRQM